jgi:arylsulfatase A-like enzyme
MEEDVSDKPWFVRKRSVFSERERAQLDSQRITMLESLLAVDEAVGAIMDALEEHGIGDDTMVVFASDNGFMWGEHRLDKKRCPYEECIRTPLIVRYPRLITEPRSETGFATNCDFMPTFLELAGAKTALHMDGRSITDLLVGRASSRRRDVLIEGWQTGYVFAGVRAERWKYVEYLSGEVELYDLENDRYETDNVAKRPRHRARLEQMAARLRELRPQWPADARAIGAYLLDSPD